ncbi:MAG TPA: hypothetical protein VFO30_05775 [Chthoniobacterales bacterium]|nr:hypothetical protein [Chthoniobacterales bacterium]
MLERITRATAAVLLISMVLPGCSMLTARGRQERAYERYVRKCSHQRDRLQAKMMKTPRIPTFEPSEPKETTEVGGSPESVTSSESATSPANAATSAETSN